MKPLNLNFFYNGHKLFKMLDEEHLYERGQEEISKINVISFSE